MTRKYHVVWCMWKMYICKFKNKILVTKNQESYLKKYTNTFLPSNYKNKPYFQERKKERSSLSVWSIQLLPQWNTGFNSIYTEVKKNQMFCICLHEIFFIELDKNIRNNLIKFTKIQFWVFEKKEGGMKISFSWLSNKIMSQEKHKLQKLKNKKCKNVCLSKQVLVFFLYL